MKAIPCTSTIQSLLSKTTACALTILMPAFTLAQTGTPTPTATLTELNISFNVGPVGASMQMTTPIQAPTGVVLNTFHFAVRDDTQTPSSKATDAVVQAADAATLYAGTLPAVMIVQNDLKAGLTLPLAIADAQAKTGVTFLWYHDDLTEYVKFYILVSGAVMTGLSVVTPPLRSQMLAIVSKLESSTAAAGGSDPTLQALLSAEQSSLTTIQQGLPPTTTP